MEKTGSREAETETVAESMHTVWAAPVINNQSADDILLSRDRHISYFLEMKIALNPVSDATKTSVYLSGQIQSIRIPNLQRSVCHTYIKPHCFVSKCQARFKVQVEKPAGGACQRQPTLLVSVKKYSQMFNTLFLKIVKKILKTMLGESGNVSQRQPTLLVCMRKYSLLFNTLFGNI